ncbi:C4-dicarboxylic acid transporter DauA [Denitrificimonas caeni]|uniref:C4-dicarboxylic acid transporter DauA n=1 Tax=Denitrificimonas caeni TaxID=521720 RepID=A0AAF0AJA9_9GAMM|nr:C4-dicarboxylic acid transporter DauA [Denitrificimonas caeni]WBE25285.1 C4-dicarboxylic acid transporter DauA [Denitrificimonas caeni]
MYIPPLFSALRQTFAEGYTLNALRGDISAGLTVGIIAIPLAMALAIAVGVPPQHGLYTVLIGGSLIALTGGSRFNVSGPTAAFVVILLPITQQFGVGGLLLCTAMAGVILIAMAVLRAGALLQFIPYPVTLGFTAGIGVVIATLQIKDAFGLTNVAPTANYIEQISALTHALPSIQLGDTLVAAITLLVLIIWPRFVPKIPGHLVALAIGSFIGLALNNADISVATIGERFSYTVDGVAHPGIPPFLPSFMWPWEMSGPDGKPLLLSFELFRQLLAPAFAIAMLGAIESLLCAVVADGMAGTKHDPNGELLGQGIGNILAPMFGGITATAAIARSAANVRAGAFSPIAAIIHAGVVLLAMLFLAPMFSHLPMAALAALLLMVAWNMSEPKHVIHTLRISPRNDVLVLLTCLSLTVLFDMVLAVGVGLLLAAGLFIKSMSDLTDTASVSPDEHDIPDLPDSVTVYAIRGPLFFGAAEKALSVLRKFNPEIRVAIIDLRAVPMLDMTALAALSNVLNDYQKNDIGIIFLGASAKVRQKMHRAGIGLSHSKISYVSNFAMARKRAQSWLDADAGVEPSTLDDDTASNTNPPTAQH